MGAAVTHFDKTGGVAITAKLWPNAVAGATQTAEKFSVQNTGDRELGTVGVGFTDLILELLQVGSNDGFTFFRIGTDTVTVIPPYEVAVALSAGGAGGVWGSTGTRGWVITATNATGETVQSLEVTVNIDDVTKKATLTWTLPTGATGIKVYRTDTPGTYTTPALRATLGAVSVFVDDGSAVAAGAPPADNTTAGAGPTYGSPPALGVGPLSTGGLKLGQTFVYWVNRIVSAGTAEVPNPRVSLRNFRET